LLAVNDQYASTLRDAFGVTMVSWYPMGIGI